MMDTLVSVIIPARDEEHYIGKFSLPSLVKQTYTNFEVYVVCNACSDKTADVARSFSKTIPRLQVIETKKGGVSYARNFGASFAKGSILVFLDADIKMVANTLEKIVKTQIEEIVYGKMEYNTL